MNLINYTQVPCNLGRTKDESHHRQIHCGTHIFLEQVDHTNFCEMVGSLKEYLDREELKRYHSFVFAKDKAIFLASRQLAKKVLAQELNCSHRNIRIFAEKRGEKPKVYLDDAEVPGFDFNLSHTRGGVACTYSWKKLVGIDVQFLNSKIPELNQPLGNLSHFNSSLGQNLFYLDWTIREAYFKAMGIGIFSKTHPMNSIALKSVDKSTVALFDQIKPNLTSGGSISYLPHSNHMLCCISVEI